VIFHIDPRTGEEIARQARNEEDEEAKKLTEEEGTLQGIDIVSGPVVEAYLLAGEGSKIVVMFDEYLQVSCPLPAVSMLMLNPYSRSTYTQTIQPLKLLSKSLHPLFTSPCAPAHQTDSAGFSGTKLP
jgi:hypothetical protein